MSDSINDMHELEKQNASWLAHIRILNLGHHNVISRHKMLWQLKTDKFQIWVGDYGDNVRYHVSIYHKSEDVLKELYKSLTHHYDPMGCVIDCSTHNEGPEFMFSYRTFNDWRELATDLLEIGLIPKEQALQIMVTNDAPSESLQICD